MNQTFGLLAASLATALLFAVTASKAELEARADVSVTVFATGLNDPRGLAFGPDQHLYVAEAGVGGGALSTVGQCDQVAPPVGPYTGGNTGRVLRFSPSGGSAVVADGLPSAEASPLIGGDKSGASALAFIGNRLLALISGAGCSHGHSDADNGILDVGRGRTAQLANLSTWLLANSGAKGAQEPRDPDYEPDGTWYSMVFTLGKLYAVEPNHGLLVGVHPKTGDITLEKDLLDTFGDHTYTALAAQGDDVYVGTLGRIAWLPNIFPLVPDFAESFKAGIYRLSRDGQATQVASGLRAVLGVAFDRAHRMYALQSPIFVPGTGSLVRQDASGQWETIVVGLNFPSALTVGPDNALYISECGYHCGPGQGRILRVTTP